MKAILLAILIPVLFPEIARAAPPVSQCSALARGDFSAVQDAPTLVTSGHLVDGERNAPAYCRIAGRVAPQIEFEVRLPEANWNGKFLALANVSTGDECNGYLRRGYACMPIFRSAKRGRQDEEWVALLLKDRVTRINAMRSTHLLTMSGKAIVSRYYAKAPRQSYFLGCSAGGNEALMEAQTFPWDFDGIAAGEPSINLADWLMGQLWRVRYLHSENGGQPKLSINDIQILHRAALAECDGDDGVKDGIIGNPVGCKFQPSALLCGSIKSTECLTSSKIDAAERLYSGPSTSKGVRISNEGSLPGAELDWPTLVSDGGQWIDTWFKFALSETRPKINASSFDFDRDYQRFGMEVVFAPPISPDLRQFKSAGGKLIAYQGGNDTAQTLRGFLDYYDTTERIVGGRVPMRDFFRLFIVPGMDHCTGGAGAYAIDYLTYLEEWVEHGRAPDAMIGAHVKDAYLIAQPIKRESGLSAGDLTDTEKATLAALNLEFPLDANVPVAFTRPIYPYPLYAKYLRRGDINQATNFGPIDPQVRPGEMH
jgi:hypothetical protein